ncbi:OmpA family protein [Hydrogenimonas sp.]
MWLVFFCILMPLCATAEQKRYTVGPMVNRLEALGKGLLDDGISYGVRFGYNFDEHKAVELSYDYLYNFPQESVPGTPSTNAHQLMANFLYNVKDDRGFIPYMIFGLGVEKYDNSQGSLKSGGIAGIGLGAHFLIVDPISLRFEVRDIVRFSDVGHTFSWTFGLEYSFGKLEKYRREELFSFSSYEVRDRAEEVAAAEPVLPPKPYKKSPATRSAGKKYQKKEIQKTERVSAVRTPVVKKTVTPPAVPVSRTKPAPRPVAKTPVASAVAAVKTPEPPQAEKKSLSTAKIPEPVKESVIALTLPNSATAAAPAAASVVKSEKTVTSKKSVIAAPKTEKTAVKKPQKQKRPAAAEAVEKTPLKVTSGGREAIDTGFIEETSAGEYRRTKEVARVPKAAAAPMPKESVAPAKEVSAVEAAVPAPAKAEPSASKIVEPKKKAGAKERPCRLDTDGDGINDCKDRCKETPRGWRVDSHGCAVGITMLVNFDFDSVRLNERDRERIGVLATYMQSHPTLRVIIQGHTDSIGSKRYNLSLSKKRALKVKEALVDLGVQPGRIETEAYGEAKPIASNKTAAGRAKNRRDDAVIIRIGTE